MRVISAIRLLEALVQSIVVRLVLLLDSQINHSGPSLLVCHSFRRESHREFTRRKHLYFSLTGRGYDRYPSVDNFQCGAAFSLA